MGGRSECRLAAGARRRNGTQLRAIRRRARRGAARALAHHDRRGRPARARVGCAAVGSARRGVLGGGAARASRGGGWRGARGGGGGEGRWAGGEAGKGPTAGGARGGGRGPRRNLVTEGVDLEALIGRQFTVGEVVMVGVRDCPPC